MGAITFIDNDGTFTIKNPENYTGLYFPLAGEKKIKSSITPNLSGDSKLDQNHFLLEPVSIENLHSNKNTRNFWCNAEGKGIWSVCGSSAFAEAEKFTGGQDESELTAGFMWQQLSRISEKFGLQATTTTFVTVEGDLEVMMVSLKNVSDSDITLTPFGVIPIYGRSADNLRDHRHVTSLLHRIFAFENRVEVKPVLSFDERGHQRNDTTYFVAGFDENGAYPTQVYETVEKFIGEGGSYLNPEAVRTLKTGTAIPAKTEGKEAVGAFQFEKITLKKLEEKTYVMLLGTSINAQRTQELLAKYHDKKSVGKALNRVKKYWKKKVNVSFYTGNKEVDNYLKWICFQPILRRIYGCSFLPYHDYGKGGRGFRDLWQDCLALLIMDPTAVRKMIVDNYQGIRIDGTNATIIGTKQGEFIADRNNITRVWMDHAFWPFVTTKLYIDQTGDLEILLEKATYFKDLQSNRGTSHDLKWNVKYGNRQRTSDYQIYHGSILEHILIQNMTQFFDIGEHGNMLLHGADWNDAIDMAAKRGESVAFTGAYVLNYRQLAQVLQKLKTACGYSKIEVLEELKILLQFPENDFDSVIKRRDALEQYSERCKHNISGKTIIVDIDFLCSNLLKKADYMAEHIRNNEWLCNDAGDGWFNGYYDDHGNPVESCKSEPVKMMLTSQVFQIMSGTATDEQVRMICESADKYLYEQSIGGYRLNTNFQEEKFDLGRMFGFAYGEKENGAVFSHMAVMYANALYQRGFVKEGYKVLDTLLKAAMNFEKSKIYPGIPEYFNNDGVGMYAYLTGAASWYMLTMIHEVYGVRGEYGDLIISPALTEHQFDEQNMAKLEFEFARRKFEIHIQRGESIHSATCDEDELTVEDTWNNKNRVRIKKEILEQLSADDTHIITVYCS